jgi:hypothetical protein
MTYMSNSSRYQEWKVLVPKIAKVLLPKNRKTNQYVNPTASVCQRMVKSLFPKYTASSCGAKHYSPNSPNSRNSLPKKSCANAKLQPQIVWARPWGLVRSHASCMHESSQQLLGSNNSTKAKPNTSSTTLIHIMLLARPRCFTHVSNREARYCH